jgi:tRNA(Arg) A34 adenosine deaminase TadA
MRNTVRDTRRGLLLALAASLLPVARAGSAAGDLPDIDQPAPGDDEAFIGRAFQLRREALDNGDQGYGAVVVRDGRIVGQAASRVVLNRDPTAHAEMEAIRDAARRTGRRELEGCTLYSSSPPCPMCEAAAYWAGIDRLVHGSTARDAGRPRLCR